MGTADNSPSYYDDVESCVEQVLSRVGKRVVLGLPIGLGKPCALVNEFYRRAKEDPSLSLHIHTALSLERPAWKSDLERRFLEPFVTRLFEGYVDLDYMQDLRRDRVPDNVQIREFYAKAGAYLHVKHAQRNYVSSNYTHAARDLVDAGVNVLAQQVAPGGTGTGNGAPYSLSCNPDVTLDVVPVLQQQQRAGRAVEILAVINPRLPFMYGDAVVTPNTFTGIVDHARYHERLFGAPKMAVTPTDYLIGLHASALIHDGGTLQIGIGSLGDALCYGLVLRQQQNEVYRRVIAEGGIHQRFGEVIDHVGGTGTFSQGLAGSTEMLVDGYLHLMRAGVVKRRTYGDLALQRLLNEGRITEQVGPETLDRLLEAGALSPQLGEADVAWMRRFGLLAEGWRLEEGHLTDGTRALDADLREASDRAAFCREALGDRLAGGVLIHAGFYLGPESFYEALRSMSDAERRSINMTSVLNVNQLYDGGYGSEALKRAQRQHGRFVNACLMVTLSGAAVSDGLDTGQMVSGVGGQYNFVAQAHELPDGRSVLMCKATRGAGRSLQSNIVFNYGHITIPKHLRDIFVTEYGIADLRGKSDQEIIAALLNITDSRFQPTLLQQAQDAGKIPTTYEIPEAYRSNLPERNREILAAAQQEGHFPAFPFGCDFTPEELVIGKALKALKARMTERLGKVSSLSRATTARIPDEAKPYLERLELLSPHGTRERMMRRLVVYALRRTGAIPS